MTKNKPVYVMDDLPFSEKQAVLSGAFELIMSTPVNIDLVDLGNWKTENYKNPDGSLKKFGSIDWYIEKGRKNSRNKSQLNADAILRKLMVEPWKESQKGGKPHYDILAVDEDIYFRDLNLAIGAADPDWGNVVLSTYRFKDLDGKIKYECIKTETIHELGHAFGLLPNERTRNVDYSLGKHCNNTCTMRQGNMVPTDWIDITNDRLRYGTLCRDCREDLKNIFRS